MEGRFITFEGGEGTGKSTQARMLADALERKSIAAVLTREPGGTPGAEAIRGLLLDNALDWNAEGEALLFAAARADHVANVIQPAVEAGKWVICDRFLDSSRAYQGGEGSISDADIMTLHSIGSRGYLPDLTILVEVDDAEREARLSARDGDESDRIGGKSATYHAKVAARFHALAEAETQRFVIVDGLGTPEDVHARVLQAVQDRLGGIS